MAQFSMTLSLNVLNHLGINLYSNVPAVLAEAVANAWDADARRVTIDIADDGSSIVIEDDGHGMTAEDINKKFLTVGYQRRNEKDEALTPELGRPVMGRKGIGKLSLFSVAETIEVQSARNGQANGLVLSLAKIKEAIKDGTGTYHPEPIAPDSVTVKKGTRIVLRDLRRKLVNTEKGLRKRLARRFSIIGPENNFVIAINNAEIGPEDREYYHKVQYLWHYGENGKKYVPLCKNLEHEEARPSTLVSGWIGTVREAGDLKDEFGESLNKIVVIVRGKLAQEDILEGFGEGGIYTKYIMGEIHADFLDLDEKEDIATSSRQSLIEDDPRYQQLKDFIAKELKHIQNQWTKHRNDHGTDLALQVPVIKKWFGELSLDSKKRAQALFGKINQLTVEKEDQRKTLIKQGVLAFEMMRYKQNLDALENISVDNLSMFAELFGHLDDLEATLYHQIVSQRIKVVQALQERVEDDVLEKIIQKHLFDHLWLLDPSWERATNTEYMEQRAEKEFTSIAASLTDEERKGRIDIKYRKTGGRHVVIELKRASVSIGTYELLPQVDKYRTALRKLLVENGSPNDAIEIVCVVGKQLKDWTSGEERQRSVNMFKTIEARVVLYQELIENSYKAYKDYLDHSKEAGRVFRLVTEIDNSPS